MPTCFVVVSSLQVPRRLHKDIKKPLQVCGASTVLGVELHTAGAPSETQTHIPSPTPGRPCTYLKKGLCSCTSPSLEPSLALVKSGAQPGGRLPASTAKPWFCAVMKQRCVSSCTHGWLCPRFPYLGGAGRWAQNETHPTEHQDPPEVETHSLHLVGAGAQGQGQQLVAQAHPKDGLGVLSGQHSTQVGHCLLAQPWVPGAIAEEEPIEVCTQTAMLGWGSHRSPCFRESQRGLQPHSSQTGSHRGH